jgi:sec-independent protein translocase protein TatA
MFGVGTPELILILAVITLLFGAKKIPELAKTLGSSARELRKGFDGDDKKPEATRNDVE